LKLASVLELIAVSSVGMATASWLVRDPQMGPIYSQGTWGTWLKDLVDGFVGGVALSGCVGVWIERARRRSPLPWGPGRWAWSVVGLYLALHYGFTFAYRAINSYRANTSLARIVDGIPTDVRASLLFWLRNAPPFLLIALGITYLGAIPKPIPTPDSREWAGRILAALIVVSGIMNLFNIGIGF
jgi:hypothetical protein